MNLSQLPRIIATPVIGIATLGISITIIELRGHKHPSRWCLHWRKKARDLKAKTVETAKE